MWRRQHVSGCREASSLPLAPCTPPQRADLPHMVMRRIYSTLIHVSQGNQHEARLVLGDAGREENSPWHVWLMCGDAGPRTRAPKAEFRPSLRTSIHPDVVESMRSRQFGEYDEHRGWVTLCRPCEIRSDSCLLLHEGGEMHRHVRSRRGRRNHLMWRTSAAVSQLPRLLRLLHGSLLLAQVLIGKQ